MSRGFRTVFMHALFMWLLTLLYRFGSKKLNFVVANGTINILLIWHKQLHFHCRIMVSASGKIQCRSVEMLAHAINEEVYKVHRKQCQV